MHIWALIPDLLGFGLLSSSDAPSVELARAVMLDRLRPIKAPTSMEQPQCDLKGRWVDLLVTAAAVAPGFPCTSFRTTGDPGAAADGERKQSMEFFFHNLHGAKNSAERSMSIHRGNQVEESGSGTIYFYLNNILIFWAFG